MGPYSHYYLAARLEALLIPEQPGEYYWGAVAPDIRYLAGMRREQTHLSQEKLKGAEERYPQLNSFLMGYRVHCLMDEVDVAWVAGAAFPLNIIQRLLRKKLSHKQMIMLVEMFYLQSAAPGKALSGSGNEFLLSLGITTEQARVYARAMQEYIASHSYEGAVSAYQKMGMINNGRLEKYDKAYQALRRQRWLSALLLSGIKRAGLDRRVMDHVLQSFR